MGNRSKINTACLASIRNINHLSDDVETFALRTRDARVDMLNLKSELAGLSLSIALLQDDCEKLSYPDNVLSDLLTNFQHVLEKCNEATHEVSVLIQSHDLPGSSSDLHWATDGRDGINKIRTNFESYKRAIAFASMVGQMVLLKDPEIQAVVTSDHMAETQHDPSMTSEIPYTSSTAPESITDVHIASISQSSCDANMQRYLDSMATVTECVTGINGMAVNSEHVEEPRWEQHGEHAPVRELLSSKSVDNCPLHSRVLINVPRHNSMDSEILTTEDSPEKIAFDKQEVQIEEPEPIAQQHSAPLISEEASSTASGLMIESTRLPLLMSATSGLDLTLHRELSRGRRSRTLFYQDSEPSQIGITPHIQKESNPPETVGSPTSIREKIVPLSILASTCSHDEEASTKHRSQLLVGKVQSPRLDNRDITVKEMIEIENFLVHGAVPNLQPLDTPFGELTELDTALTIEVSGLARHHAVGLLLSRGARANANPAILQHAMNTWSITIVKLLIANGARLPLSYDSTTQLLFLKAQETQTTADTVRFLLSAGVDPNMVLENRLSDAFSRMSSEIPSTEHPANRPDLAALYTRLTGVEHTILSLAILSNRREVAEVLLLHGVTVPAPGEALRLACLCGNLNMVDLFLRHAQMRNKLASNTLAIYCAAAVANRDVVKLLISSGSQVSGFPDEHDKSLNLPTNSSLLLAIKMGQTTAAQILVDHGAVISQLQFASALEYASDVRDGLKSKQLFDLIVRSGKPRSKDINDGLCKAVTSGNAVMTESLLRIGNPNAEDSEDRVLCVQAARANKPEVLKVILSHNPRKSSTALRIAAQRGNVGIVAMLLDYGVSIDAQDTLNMAPLHRACTDNQLEVVELLIQRGAKINLKSKQGTPLKVAQTRLENLSKGKELYNNVRRCEKIITLLESKSKKKGLFR